MNETWTLFLFVVIMADSFHFVVVVIATKTKMTGHYVTPKRRHPPTQDSSYDRSKHLYKMCEDERHSSND